MTMASAPVPIFVGLDVGSHTSCVATSCNEIVEVKLNSEGKRETPSSVAYGKRRVVGGLGSAGQNATVISEVKHVMGKRFDDPVVMKLRKAGRLGDVVEGVGGRCGFRVPSADIQHDVVPEQIMATLLKHMASIAQGEDTGTCKAAVLSVPVFFGEAERSAVLTAAELAGLSDVHLMNDLTAAALEWSVLHAQDLAEKKDPLRVAFVDVGHSNTQVCIADITSTEIRVVAHAWDSMLGGRHLDELLTAGFAKKLYAAHRLYIKKDPRSCTRLIKEVRKMRETLTIVQDAHVELEDLMGDIDFSMDINRKQFEETAAEAMKRISELCQKANTQAQEQHIPMHAVEMVGAASRTLLIEKIVGQAFGQSVKRTMNSKECVSQGCATWAAMQSQFTSPSQLQIIDQASSEIFCEIHAKDGNRKSLAVFGPCHHKPELRMSPQECKIPIPSLPSILKFSSGAPGSDARQALAEVYMGDTVKAPEDTIEKEVSVRVRLDRNGLFRCMTAAMQYAKVYVGHIATYSNDASKTELEAWQMAEQTMMADDENQRLTDQARNEFEKLNISMKKKLDREWACCSNLPYYQSFRHHIETVDRQLRGDASHIRKEDFIKAYTAWQRYEREMDSHMQLEKQKINSALHEIQHWCNGIDANRPPFFGLFCNQNRKKELRNLCQRTKQWLWQARGSNFTTLAGVHYKMAEFQQEKVWIEEARNIQAMGSASASPKTIMQD